MGSIPEISIIKGLNRDYSTHRMHRIFEANLNSSCCGNKPAIIFNNRIDGDLKFTYTQLNYGANQMAAYLIDQINMRELEPNQDGDWIIAICMPPSHELVIALLAILKTGAAYLPIDPTFSSSRIEHIFQEANPAFVIYDKNAIACNVFGSTATISFDECEAMSSNYDDANITDDRMLSAGIGHLALVLYTSGSTGVPKGVRLPHSIIMNRLEWQWETFPYSVTESIGVFKTALTFVDSVSEIWGPLLTERAVLVVPKCITKDPTQLVALLQKYEIERLVLVPTLLKSLLIYLSLKRDANLLSKLKLWVCSGETLPASLAMEFYNYFAENEYLLCNFYGSTEVMGDVTYYICKGKEQLRQYTHVPIGSPIFNTNICLLDAENKPVKVGIIGELYVSGSNLAHGYVNGRDKDRFIDNFMAVDPKYGRLYRTGDYASICKGVLHYEGRTDSQVKIRGHRVDLTEIEKNLIEIDDVEKGIVLCYHAGQMDQAILAFASIKSSSSLHELQIEKILRDKLPEYMTPQVIILHHIPLLVNGKIDRQTLLKMYENTNNNDDPELAIDYDYSGLNLNDLQRANVLFETIGEVIGRSTRTTISAECNFYALGGNSLNSIYTVAKLRDKGYFIEITNFIAAKNLKETLAYMTKIELSTNTQRTPTVVKNNFFAVPLAMEHKTETIHIISMSFMEKAELEQQLKPNINYNDYVDLLELIWNALVEKGYSFIIKDENSRTIGVALNFDANDEPEVDISGPLSIIFEFLDFIEVPIKDRLPKDRPILHSFMMGTHESLNPQENIEAMTFMESEVLRLAIEKECCGILTTNTNALTQQLARNVFDYETLLDYQVNQYLSGGNKPFGAAPDHYRAIVQWKKL